jgi:hypothetical protein
MLVSAVEPPISAGVKNTISSAGSARLAISISRREPSVPNAVPTSIAASAIATRASANRPTRAITSAAGANGRSVATSGTMLAASTIQANTT